MSSDYQLSVIMFTDIVGYTSLMEIDEQRALDVLNSSVSIQSEIIAQHNGRIVKELGDGLLCLFPSPILSVRAAIEIQKAIQQSDLQFQLKIAIHSGEVILKPNDVLGNDVNVASRIETVAVADSIVLSEKIESEIRNKGIETEPLGSFQFKNVSKPLHLYAVKSDGLVIPESMDVPTGRGTKIRLNKVKTWSVLAIFAVLMTILAVVKFDEYRDRRSKQTELRTALHSIKAEVESNIEIYQSNVNRIGSWLSYWEKIQDRDENGYITISKKEYDNINAFSEYDRRANWKLIDYLNDTMMVYEVTGDVTIDVIPESGISVIKWTALLNTDILSDLPNEKAKKLSLIYEWVNKDLGVSDQETLMLEDMMKQGYDNIDLIVAYLYRARNAHQLKLHTIEPVYEEINWEF